MSPERSFVTRPGRRRRGEPLVVLAMVLGGWVAGRAALWDGLPVAASPRLALRETVALARPAAPAPVGPQAVARSFPAVPLLLAPPPLAQPAPTMLDVAAPASIAGPIAAPVMAPVAPPPQAAPATPVRVASAHALLWMAAVGNLPLPPLPASAMVRAAPPPPRRWSADGWLLVRRGGEGFSPAGGLPTYGASQLGAVLRYRLDSAPAGRRPQAYLRLSGALAGAGGALGEHEAALGLSARPLPGVPVRVMAEARLSRFASGATEVRPSASAVTELAPITLPFATRAEFYAQAGYVGGPGATGFVDGQAQLDRRIARLGRAELRGGAGLWGGAQRGAGRLDGGPTVTLNGPLGPGGARLAMDWRFRLAGNAAPSSGPALTLSAGF